MKVVSDNTQADIAHHRGREAERWLAGNAIVRGVLQVVAANLLGQKFQELAGEHQMRHGLNTMQTICDAERREFVRGKNLHKQPTRKKPAAKRTLS